MSIGRMSMFLDAVILARPPRRGRLDEAAAQELIDHWLWKPRIVRFLSPVPDYGRIVSGDPYGRPG